MPHFGIIICLLEERIRSNICEILWPRLMGTGIKLQSIQGRSQYIVSDRNKHFKFDLDRKPNLQLKIEPTFLAWLPKGKIEKTTEYLLFSLFIQFSAIEIRWVLSHPKLMIHVSWLLRLEKKWDACARWWAIAIFSLTEHNIKANPPCFQYALAWGCAKWLHKLWAERMRNANVRNHLKQFSSLTQKQQLSRQVRRKKPVRKRFQATEFYLSITKNTLQQLVFATFRSCSQSVIHDLGFFI